MSSSAILSSTEASDLQVRNAIFVGYLSGTLFTALAVLQAYRGGAPDWMAFIDGGLLLVLSLLFSRMRRPFFAAALVAYAVLYTTGAYFVSGSFMRVVSGIVMLFYFSLGFAGAYSKRNAQRAE